MASTLLDIDINKLLKALEKKIDIKLPRRVISISLAGKVLHIRFNYPKVSESDVMPLLLKTPIYLFRDEETGETTALEILDVDEALAELSEPVRKAS